jgi:hypothetical protein
MVKSRPPGWFPEHIEVLSDEMAEVLRQKTGAERLAIAFGMFSSARRMLRSQLEAEYPEWSEEEVAAEVARRILGAD